MGNFNYNYNIDNNIMKTCYVGGLQPAARDHI